MNLSVKICNRCNREYAPTGKHQKYCEECGLTVFRERDCAKSARYYLTQVGRVKARSMLWQQTHPGAVSRKNRKRYCKRRSFGYVTLNIPFAGCEGHHVNLNEVIFIPAKLHDSIPHNVFTGKNMDIINALAYQWLSRGGKHSKDNVVPACTHCNCSKNAKTPEEWTGLKI